MSRPQFYYARHACPHCKSVVQLPYEIWPKIGDAIVIECANRLCMKPYYLSWLGPWDMDETTVPGKERRLREQRFAERIANERERNKS